MQRAIDHLMRLYTTQEVSALLRITKTTLYQLTKTGHLKGVRLGRMWRFPAEEVDAFIKRGGAEVISRKSKVTP